ncbi:hypothetical protein E2C01_011211 [Portunus trituberculatus]|uniref:Uncharacterized protein n=1 Tax=Portunus trituberculatus TaxID=210409 RepID=A0A5B7DAT2_PORTR|nr:hypothetical protein [Portunus trituberculatus]
MSSVTPVKMVGWKKHSPAECTDPPITTWAPHATETKQKIKPTWRDSSFLSKFSKSQSRERSVLGRFDDTGAAGGQSCSRLTQVQHCYEEYYKSAKETICTEDKHSSIAEITSSQASTSFNENFKNQRRVVEAMLASQPRYK